MTTSGNSAPIQSIERAAQVLDLFIDGRHDLDLNEITELLGFSRATAHRYCVSLRKVGLLRYDPETGHYGLGARVIELGTVALNSLPFVRLAEPFIHELVKKVDRTAAMTVWDGQAPIIVHVDDGTSALVRISIRIGARLPVFRSAQGIIYLALSPSIRRQIARTDAAENLERLEDELQRVRDTGVSMHSEVTRGIRAMGVPVFRDEDVVATFALVGTEGTIPQDLDDDATRALISTARAASVAITEQT